MLRTRVELEVQLRQLLLDVEQRAQLVCELAGGRRLGFACDHDRLAGQVGLVFVLEAAAHHAHVHSSAKERSVGALTFLGVRLHVDLRVDRVMLVGAPVRNANGAMSRGASVAVRYSADAHVVHLLDPLGVRGERHDALVVARNRAGHLASDKRI